MKKAFLSHSSTDESLVHQVYTHLGESIAELDVRSFEKGFPTWESILKAFERCHVFCLFATTASSTSPWVKREVREARRRVRDARIRRLLVFSLDGTRLSASQLNVNDFVVYLNLKNPENIANAIRRHLLDLEAIDRGENDHFVGRDRELGELKSKLLDPTRKIVGMSVSGLRQIGRSALIIRAMHDLFPRQTWSQRLLEFHVFESCADLALDIHALSDELVTPDRLSFYRDTFSSDDSESCGRKLYDLLAGLHRTGQFVIFSDRGGIINHRGRFTNITSSLLRSASASSEMTIFFITTRRPIPSARTEFPSIAFIDVSPLSEKAAEQYIVHKARVSNVTLDNEQISTIVRIGGGHPRFFDFLIDRCKQYPPDQALAAIDDIDRSKKEWSEMVLSDSELSENAQQFIRVLKHYFSIPAEFVETIFDSHEVGIETCAELLDKYVVTESHGVFTLSPLLSDMIARDNSIVLEPIVARTIAGKFARLLKGYQDEGVVPVSIIDAASIASIETGDHHDNWLSSFILPSHYVYLARRAYNQRQYKSSLDYCNSAIGYRSSLTDAAYIYVCRTLGMAAARLGDADGVAGAVRLLNGVSDPYARSSAAFVRGFEHRLCGRFRDAEDDYVLAREGLRDDAPLLRELALVNFLRRNNERAIDYGEKALSVAPPNSPFLLDIVARALIERPGANADLEYGFRIRDVMERLRRSCESAKHTFHLLRDAEWSLAMGHNHDALQQAERAIAASQDVAAAHLVRARAQLSRGKIREARADCDVAKDHVNNSLSRRYYFMAEIIRVEIEIELRRKRFASGISLFNQLEKFQIGDSRLVGARIARAIDRDKTDLDELVRTFAKQYR